MQVFASVTMGAGVFVLAAVVIRLLSTTDDDWEDEWRYDATRISELRRISPLYRTFQPLIQLLARANHRLFRDQLPEIGRQIQAAGLPRFWTASEYLARMELLALLMVPAYLYVCIEFMGAPGAVSALLLSVFTGYLLRRRLATTAQQRLLSIKRRMPFVLDLLTLLMEAGSTFIQAMSQAVNEFRHHAVGAEFGRVLSEINMGKSRTEALESMRSRLSDDEVTSIIGSIIQGEELGTPLALLFRTQADVLRIKRTQRAETIAGEAGVKMLLPAVLVMAATVLIILGPFVLNFICSDLMSLNRAVAS